MTVLETSKACCFLLESTFPMTSLTFVHAGGSGWTSDASHQFSWNATDAYSGIETVSMYVDGVV